MPSVDSPMGTPTSVKYSRVPGTPEEALLRFDEQVLPTCGLEYSGFAALVPDDDPWTEGFDLADDIVDCHAREEALALARGRGAWGLVFLARRIPGDVHFHALEIRQDSFGTLLTFDESMVYAEDHQFGKGEWLVRLFTRIAETLGCDMCGYGRDDAYEKGYDALEPATVLARLRAGELFTMAWPNFHAISVKRVTPEEMNDLLARLPKGQFFKYELTTTGYHLLSAM